LRCGSSLYVAGVRGEIGSPTDAAHPSHGRIVVTTDFSKLCGADFRDEAGPSQNLSVLLSKTLTQLVNHHKAIDLSQLCIKETEAVWVLYVDVVCLEYDGNFADLPLLASVAALRNVRLPVVTYDTSAKAYRRTTDEATQRVHFKSSPVCVTFSRVLDEDAYWLADPTREEEELGTALTVAFVGGAGEREVTPIRWGGAPVDLERVSRRLLPTASRIKEDVYDALLVG